MEKSAFAKYIEEERKLRPEDRDILGDIFIILVALRREIDGPVFKALRARFEEGLKEEDSFKYANVWPLIVWLTHQTPPLFELSYTAKCVIEEGLETGAIERDRLVVLYGMAQQCRCTLDHIEVIAREAVHIECMLREEQQRLYELIQQSKAIPERLLAFINSLDWHDDSDTSSIEKLMVEIEAQRQRAESAEERISHLNQEAIKWRRRAKAANN